MMSIKIIQEFESLLDNHDIKIPSEDREGEPCEASIHGIEYYELEDAITGIVYDGVIDMLIKL